MVRFREAGEADAEALARLLTELNEVVGADSLPPGPDKLPENVVVSSEQMDERLQVTSGLEMVLLAEENGDPAGFAALRIVPYLGQDLPYAEVTQLYVVPAHRRRGAGLALMRRAEEIARDRGCTSVHVTTGRDNLEAQAVYRAADYEALYVTFEKFL